MQKNDNTPLITVITPYYNSENTFFSSLDSILSQTYSNIQFILVNDGSISFDELNIKKYLNSHKKENIKEYSIISYQQNLGTVKALNKALKVAKGEYIFTLGADDEFYDENVLTDWVNEFIKTNAKVITAKRAVYDSTMSKEKYIAPSKDHINMISTLSPTELLEQMEGFNFIFSSCTSYKKECYDLAGGLDERYRLIEDYPLNVKLLRNNIHFIFFDRIVVKYRLGGISNFTNMNKSYLNEEHQIFKNEILHYSTNKLKAYKKYLKWRNSIILKRDLTKFRQKYNPSASLSNKIKYRIRVLFSHPLYVIYYIYNILKKKK
ncbi:MAG: glycosyltransferase [Clostridia bacterium]|nr:glycosyltransferase [Clostridia bacterium]